MTDITTTADLNDRNNSDADAATPSAWPYTARSGILDRKLAANIRAWALTNKSGPHMTQAELHSYSQGQLLSMYLEQHIRPTLERAGKRCAGPAGHAAHVQPCAPAVLNALPLNALAVRSSSLSSTNWG